MKKTIAVLVILLLAGCAPTESPSYAPDAATALQTQVLAVTEASAAGDLEGTLARLDELEAMANDALEAETVTAERHTAILAAIALVRADIQAAIAVRDAPPPPEPTNSDSDSAPGKSDDKGKPDEKGKKD